MLWFALGPKNEDLSWRVLQQPGDVVRAEAIAVGPGRCDHAIEGLVLHQQAEGVPHAPPGLDTGVDAHALRGGALLDRLEQRQRDPGLPLQWRVELYADRNNRQVGRNEGCALGAGQAKRSVEGRS